MERSRTCRRKDDRPIGVSCPYRLGCAVPAPVVYQVAANDGDAGRTYSNKGWHDLWL